VPFGVFGWTARPRVLPPQGRPLGIGCSFRVCDPHAYRPYGFGAPTLPLALAPAVWSSVVRAGLIILQRSADILSSSFAFLQSITHSNLAVRRGEASGRNGSSLGLFLPTAHEGSKVHSPRALPARCVPPSGFGYPLDGFLPSVPRRFCFTPAALMGFTLRSFPLSEGIRCVSATEGPTYRFTRRYTRAAAPEGARAEPARRAAVPGLCPFRECLTAQHGFSTLAAGGSLGFRPFQGLSPEALAGISPRLLSRASQTRRQAAEPTGAPECQSAPDSPRPPTALPRLRTGQPS